jgi:hypothetical protein
MSLKQANIAFGGLALLAAVLALLLWLPNDTGSSMIVHVRGRVKIGDALAPGVALAILVVAGLLIMVEALKQGGAALPSGYNIRYGVVLFLLFAGAIVLMRWTGPLAVWLVGPGEGIGYRELRDTVPWKYLGFMTGGTFLVAGLISLAEWRITWKAVMIGLATTILLILLYDLPFDDLLLPPNGDV